MCQWIVDVLSLHTHTANRHRSASVDVRTNPKRVIVGALFLAKQKATTMRSAPSVTM